MPVCVHVCVYTTRTHVRTSRQKREKGYGCFAVVVVFFLQLHVSGFMGLNCVGSHSPLVIIYPIKPE